MKNMLTDFFMNPLQGAILKNEGSNSQLDFQQKLMQCTGVCCKYAKRIFKMMGTNNQKLRKEKGQYHCTGVSGNDKNQNVENDKNQSGSAKETRPNIRLRREKALIGGMDENSKS